MELNKKSAKYGVLRIIMGSYGLSPAVSVFPSIATNQGKERPVGVLKIVLGEAVYWYGNIYSHLVSFIALVVPGTERLLST